MLMYVSNLPNILSPQQPTLNCNFASGSNISPCTLQVQNKKTQAQEHLDSNTWRGSCPGSCGKITRGRLCLKMAWNTALLSEILETFVGTFNNSPVLATRNRSWEPGLKRCCRSHLRTYKSLLLSIIEGLSCIELYISYKKRNEHLESHHIFLPNSWLNFWLASFFPQPKNGGIPTGDPFPPKGLRLQLFLRHSGRRHQGRSTHGGVDFEATAPEEPKHQPWVKKVRKQDLGSARAVP